MHMTTATYWQALSGSKASAALPNTGFEPSAQLKEGCHFVDKGEFGVDWWK